MSRSEFLRRVWITVGVVALVTSIVTMFVLAYDVFFLIFLALLLAILLRSAADLVANRTGLGPGWSLAIVLVVLLILTGAGTYGLGAMAVAQFDRVVADLPHALDEFKRTLSQYEWGRQWLNHAPSPQQLVMGRQGEGVTRVAEFFSTTLGVLTNVLVLIFLTIYLAVSPGTYRSGFHELVPPAHRTRAEQVLDTIGSQLRWWLVGRFVAMVAVAILVAIGLWMVGVPQFLVLGLLAGLLTAVPYIGPITAAAPGVLLALMISPTAALWAIVVYTLAQAVENYLLSPLIQQNTVSLPPVLAIVAIALGGALFGLLG
jgi:predicted PurR-regulated permease PerM